MKKWTLPDSYFGAEWHNHFVFIGQHRDSDALTRSNFRCAQRALEATPTPADWPHDEPPWQAVSENHWAVGWVEWLAIHEDAAAHIAVAEGIETALEAYPVVDESDWSDMEQEEARETWKNCYNERERVEYIREHRSQFDFSCWSDLRAVIRGEYFNGYASELIQP